MQELFDELRLLQEARAQSYETIDQINEMIASRERRIAEMSAHERRAWMRRMSRGLVWTGVAAGVVREAVKDSPGVTAAITSGVVVVTSAAVIGLPFGGDRHPGPTPTQRPSISAPSPQPAVPPPTPHDPPDRQAPPQPERPPEADPIPVSVPTGDVSAPAQVNAEMERVVKPKPRPRKPRPEVPAPTPKAARCPVDLALLALDVQLCQPPRPLLTAILQPDRDGPPKDQTQRGPSDRPAGSSPGMWRARATAAYRVEAHPIRQRSTLRVEATDAAAPTGRPGPGAARYDGRIPREIPPATPA